MERVHKPKLDICHLHGLGATYPKYIFLVDPYVHMIPNWYTKLYDKQVRHILNIYYWNF